MRILSRPSPPPQVAWGLALAVTVLGACPTRVQAELPPWVYGQRQRQAPLVVRLRVLEAVRRGEEAQVRGRLLRVWRQPHTSALRPGQTIDLRYTLSPERPPGWVGPSSLPLPRGGEKLTVWLQPSLGSPGLWTPAAGGRSFGPSLEAIQEPGSTTTPSRATGQPPI